MNLAIVHDYLIQAGGAERVVATLHEIFPSAPIYTTIVDHASLWPSLRRADIRTSWMQSLPGLRGHFRVYFPLYARAVESFDLRGYDVVLSSSSAFAKGAIKAAGAVHVCYCHSPMRFGWDFDRYVERTGVGPIRRLLLGPLIERARRWDLRTAGRPDLYVANSTATARRIREIYGRESSVIFPPVDVERWSSEPVSDDFYLVLCRLLAYKRVDLAIRAFKGFGRRLVVIGDGPARPALERLAGPEVTLLGRLPDTEIAGYYARCRALVVPGEEDFGITPLEANASGRPVIAYRAGGVLDSVEDGRTGVLFATQTAEALRGAVLRLERLTWDKELLRAHAERFSPRVFRTRILDAIDHAIQQPRPGSR